MKFYLIDDDKIIKNNSLNKKLKFLAPKDGIEEEYLIQSGIADLSIDSLKELPKYIIKRYEELKLLENSYKDLNIIFSKNTLSTTITAVQANRSAVSR